MAHSYYATRRQARDSASLHLLEHWPMANCCDFHHHNILSTPQRIGIAPPVRREHSAHSLVAYRCGANRGWLRLGRVIEIPYARPTSIRYYRKPTDLDERSGRSSPIISLQRALGIPPEPISVSTCDWRLIVNQTTHSALRILRVSKYRSVFMQTKA